MSWLGYQLNKGQGQRETFDGSALQTNPTSRRSKLVEIMCKVEGKDLCELLAAARHLEDLEVFAGQRSRLNPEPGWELVLEILRRELTAVVVELRQMGVTKKFGTLGAEDE